MKRWFAVSLLALVFVAAGVALFPEPAFADGIIIPRPPPDRPELRWRDVPLTVKYHHVDITIKDQVAVTHVDQVFVNDAPYAVEGTYMFPLPEDAAISSFEMWVDGQKLEGRLLGREQARQIYEDIVRKEKDPALLEYAGRGAFQASIFPIPPRAERRVELTYTQALVSREGLTGYRYPLNTEKFSARPLGEVKINVSVEERAPLRAIYSPSHEVDVKRNGDRGATISYRATNVKPSRDFELYYSLSPDSVALNLLSYKPFDEDGFFLLLVTPPVTAETDEVVDRDVILVMDTSGSMAGEKIEQAKAAAGYVLDHLGEGDRFNIVAFSTSTRLFSSSPVALARRGDGRAFVKGLRAEGSTDINRALLEALGGANPERPTVVIFLTDGLPTAGEVNADKIIANVAARAAKSVRLFAFGVGYDVDTTLLDRLSSGQRGTSSYVQPKQAIDEVVSGFYARMSAPVLIDTTLKVNGTTVEDMYPFPLPDLYAGTQLVVAGRYRKGGPVTLELSGQVNDRPQRYSYDDLTLAERGGSDFIPQLWAQRKVGYLLGQIRLHGAKDELIKEVVDLSTRYGIITPYTSFLVQEPGSALTQSGRDQIAQNHGLPLPTPAFGRGGGGVVPNATAAPAAAPAASIAGGPASGQAAVERAVAEKDLQSSEQSAAPVGEQLRKAGDKTFLLSGGAWIDTEFDRDRMTAEAIAFGSERYFQLLRDNPDLGRYLSLGDKVTVVLAGKAYAVGAEGEAGARPAPAAAGSGAPVPTGGPATRAPATPARATAPASASPAPAATPATVAQSNTATPSISGTVAQPDPTQGAPTLCGLPLVALLGVLGAVVALRRLI